VELDVLRDPDGQRIGSGLALTWSRASEPVQAPGHAPDLGVELNFKLYFQAADGMVDADVERMGGFYTSLEYGVLFPLDGLDYLPGEKAAYAAEQDGALEVRPAQALRAYLGVLF